MGEQTTHAYDDVEQDGEPHNAEETFPAGDSALERIARRRDEKRKQAKALRLPIPTWQGDLVGVYGIIEAKQQRKLVRRIERSEGAMLDNATLLVKACRGFEIRNDDDDLVPLLGADGEALDFHGLAAKLGIADRVQSQTDVVIYLCSDRDDDGNVEANPLAVGGHASDVMRWMQDPSARIDGAIQGE